MFQKNFILNGCRLICLCIVALTAYQPVFAAQAPDPATKAGFMPHKALYEIKLAGTKSGSQILNISGQMLYEWQPQCEAWTSSHRFNLLYEYADSPPLSVTSDFTTYETFDGSMMSFSSQRKRDGELFEELRGKAVINEDKDGEVLYTKPDGLEFDMPPGTLFPMAHSLEVLEALTSGQKFVHATIFDGSDEEGPVQVNAFIGKPVNVMALIEPSEELDIDLINAPAHNIRLAFFPISNPESSADYEMSVVFHNNGVISDMLIEYDDFSVTQKLIAIEKLPGACETEEGE